MRTHPIARILNPPSSPATPAPSSKYLRYEPKGIPQALREHPCWLVCDSSGQPVRRRGVGDSKTKPKHWADFATVSRIAANEPELWPYIVLTDETAFTVFDVDFKPQREHETGEDHWARIARAESALDRLRVMFPVRYESKSKSGKGFHIIVRGKFVGTNGKGKDEWRDVEIYTRRHGIALTGHVVGNHDDPAEYPAATLQSTRDEIKGGAPSPDSWEDMPDRRRHGSVSHEWAREILAELARLHGRPGREDWLKISSSVFDGVGVDVGVELLVEFFPEEREGEYKELAASLQFFAPWGTLNAYLKDSDLEADEHFLMPDMSGDEEAKPARKRLADFLVNHSDTLGMSWQQIDALRPPYVIDGFLRQGEVLLLGAESKSRKSWLAQDAGFAVAAGLPWLADTDGAHGFATAQARVHVFDLELNPAEMRYRFAKARGNRFAESPEDAAAMTARVAAYSFDGMNVKEIMQRLEELKSSVHPGDLVIVDCLYRLCPDGNEVAPLAEILEAVKRFASETQAGVILVDHFRKAGDDKARNRFAGSFVKQASASTLVAIEVTADDVLVLNIDARTFHGCPKVHARFNPETYAFNRLPEIEVEKAKQGRTLAEAERWILQLWHGRAVGSAVTAADAADNWKIKRQGAVPRLGKLVSRGWLIEKKKGAGKATEWTLAPDGAAAVKHETDDL
jgi:hypothetical protein